MRFKNLVLCLLAFAFLSIAACAPRPLHQGFDKYLREHPTELQKTDERAGFTIDQESMDMQYIFNSFTAGGGLVMPGLMLKNYLEITAWQAFAELKPDVEGRQPLQLRFHVNSYKFEDFRAHVDLHVSAYRNQELLFEKDYQAKGQKQTGKMFWGGGPSQRYAVHQSTQFAFNEIMNALVGDLR